MAELKVKPLVAAPCDCAASWPLFGEVRCREPSALKLIMGKKFASASRATARASLTLATATRRVWLEAWALASSSFSLGSWKTVYQFPLEMSSRGSAFFHGPDSL